MVTIVDYGDECIEKTASSIASLTQNYRVSKSEYDICNADKIILTGCGSITKVMRKIQLLNLYSVLKVIRKPMLGIGLGMQLMSGYSEEGNFPCLGFFAGTTSKFIDYQEGNEFKGMHRINFCKESLLFKGIEDNSEFLFNNSYYLPVSEQSTSECRNGISFCASIESSNAYAVQFHPEMSGEVGLALLNNFLEI